MGKPKKNWLQMDLESLREKLDLTQLQAAKIVGAGKMTWWRWEKAGRIPTDAYEKLMAFKSERTAGKHLRNRIARMTGMALIDADPSEDPVTTFRKLADYLLDKKEAGAALAMWALADAGAEKRQPTADERNEALTYLEWGGLPRQSLLEDKVPKELENAYEKVWQRIKTLAKSDFI